MLSTSNSPQNAYLGDRERMGHLRIERSVDKGLRWWVWNSPERVHRDKDGSLVENAT